MICVKKTPLLDGHNSTNEKSVEKLEHLFEQKQHCRHY